MPNLVELVQAVSEVKHAVGRAEMTSPLYVHFMSSVQITHKKRPSIITPFLKLYLYRFYRGKFKSPSSGILTRIVL
jgi:hypothetical protein